MWSYSNAIDSALLAFLKRNWDGKRVLDVRGAHIHGLSNSERVDHIQAKPHPDMEMSAIIINETLGVSSTLHYTLRVADDASSMSMDSLSCTLIYYTGYFDRDSKDSDPGDSEPGDSDPAGYEVHSIMTYASTRAFFDDQGTMECVVCGAFMGRPKYAGYAQGMIARKGRLDKLDALPVCYSCYDVLSVEETPHDIVFKDGARLYKVGYHNSETHYD